eukprot:TRINITY_DN965_c0_g1_i3.p1 TRINITY_DN965_c0_g1~~TRINITY_DN965_c0_g1_i3.p1  ORF type:complete len:754 (-),score=86.13 TRINITY_DN965_c0_g1_i3:1019-3280(-)
MKGSQEMHLGEPSQRQFDSEGRPAVHSSCTCGALSEACCPGTEKEPLVSCTCGTRENESSEERVDRCRDVPLNLNRRAAVKSSLHDLEFEDISLREWLNTPNRIVDRTECLHIFKQILDIVSIAHSDGVVLQNIRPSCFMLSSFNRVSFIDSASCSSSGSENSFDGTGAASTVFCHKTGNPQYSRHYTEDTGQSSNVKNEGTSSDLHLPQLSSDMTVAMTPADEYREIYEDLKLSDIRKDALQATDEEDNAKQRDQSLRLKEILLTELSWYTSPEELSGGPVTFASDIYCLGVLLFELFCSFSSESEQQIIISNLRHRLLPPQMLRRWRNEASFCLRLLHPDPSSRPNLSEIMQSEVIVSAKESLEEWQSAVNLNEKTIDTELLRDFLLHVEKQKQERIQKLSDAISFLTSDIRKVFSHQSSYMGRIVLEKPPPELEQVDEVNVSSGKASMLGKHLRQESMRTNGCSRIEMGREILSKEGQDKILSKKTRLMRNFRKLEHAYFAMRCNAKPVSPICIGRNYCGTSESDFIITKDGLNPCLLENSVGGQHGENISGRLGAFFDNLCKFLKFSKFEVKARLRQRHLLNSSDLVCSLSFDRETEYFATAGVNKKIKVFEFDTVLHEPMDISYPLIEMNGRSKFSCICWNNYINSQIASTDFEGAVRLWDIGRGQSTLELKEHSKRAWSVDFSQSDPKLLASGSDDCTMKLWSISEVTPLIKILEWFISMSIIMKDHVLDPRYCLLANNHSFVLCIC